MWDIERPNPEIPRNIKWKRREDVKDKGLRRRGGSGRTRVGGGGKGGAINNPLPHLAKPPQTKCSGSQRATFSASQRATSSGSQTATFSGFQRPTFSGSQRIEFFTNQVQIGPFGPSTPASCTAERDESSRARKKMPR